MNPFSIFSYRQARNRNFGIRKTRGFTLIEVMIAVSIMAVLMGLAVPSFMKVIASNQVTVATNDSLSFFTYARAEALKLGKRVTMCASSDLATCSDTAFWSDGFIIFVDNDRTSGLVAIDTDDEVLKAIGPKNGSIRVSGDADVAEYVSYGADGKTKKIDGTRLSGIVKVCSFSSKLEDAERSRDITISSSGSVFSEVGSSIGETCE